MLLIAKYIALGLQYIHHHHILHLDLKSDNIFIFNNFKAKIGDFGNSMSLQEAKERLHLDRMDTLLGTLPYLAPELLCQGHGPITTKVDIYAYGILLFELFTNQRPFLVQQPHDVNVVYNTQDIGDIIFINNRTFY